MGGTLPIPPIIAAVDLHLNANLDASTSSHCPIVARLSESGLLQFVARLSESGLLQFVARLSESGLLRMLQEYRQRTSPRLSDLRDFLGKCEILGEFRYF